MSEQSTYERDALEVAFDALDPIGELLDRAHICQPREWPVNVRRAFLLTLPVSGALWLAICAVLMAALAIYMVTAAPAVWLARTLRKRTLAITGWFALMWRRP